MIRRKITALLVDLEGTVYQAGRLIENAGDAIAALEARGIRIGYATNTTSRPRSVVARDLAGMGLTVAPERIFTAPRAAREDLVRRGVARCSLLLRETLREDFDGIAFDDQAPQAVVLGDLGDEMTFARLNRAFRHILAGAELVTLARNRYWRAADGLTLDVGAFAAALEYGSGRARAAGGETGAGVLRVGALGARRGRGRGRRRRRRPRLRRGRRAEGGYGGDPRAHGQVPARGAGRVERPAGRARRFVGGPAATALTSRVGGRSESRLSGSPLVAAAL